MIIKDGTSKGVPTTLQKGDKCVWYKNHGTVGFGRSGSQVLRRRNGDDKFLLKPANLIQFNECVQMVAEAAGLTAILVSDGDELVTYRFE